MNVGQGSQKLAPRAKVWSVLSTPTPDFKYYLMHFSKKFVVPWRLIISIHSNGKWDAIFVVYSAAKGDQDQELVSTELDVVTNHGQISLNYKTRHHMGDLILLPLLSFKAVLFLSHIILLCKQADRGCARSRLLIICVVAKRMVHTTINLVTQVLDNIVRYDTSKKGGNAPQGLRIKRARDDYVGYLILRKPHYC